MSKFKLRLDVLIFRHFESDFLLSVFLSAKCENEQMQAKLTHSYKQNEKISKADTCYVRNFVLDRCFPWDHMKI